MPRFALDAHLGRLAKYLRILGVDATYWPGIDDDVLLAHARTEGRQLISMDRLLIERAGPQLAYRLRASDPMAQLRDLMTRYAIDPNAYEPLSRCLVCNAPLEALPREAVRAALPEQVRDTHAVYRRCPSCERIYWPGSHERRMRAFAESVRAARPGPADHGVGSSTVTP